MRGICRDFAEFPEVCMQANPGRIDRVSAWRDTPFLPGASMAHWRRIGLGRTATLISAPHARDATTQAENQFSGQETVAITAAVAGISS